jgi:CHAT domain-containing protein
MLTLPIGRAELEQAVRMLRQQLDVTLAQEALPTYPSDLAYALYGKLLAPALPALTGARRLLIIADGPLQSLPLSVLVTAPAAPGAGTGQLAWLVRRYALATLPSEASFAALRGIEGRQRAREPFVGFGDPAFHGPEGAPPRVSTLYTARGLGDATQLSQLPALPDSASEITQMARLLRAGPGAINLRAAATETRVKTLDLSRYKTLAFATHGFIAGELQGVAEPALALTPPAQPSELDDGLLTASEVARLRLNADWVILSACSTAAPDGSLGAEGLSGLARAFIFAGSRGLLVSHWPVESRAAAATTTSMLQALSRQPGISRDEALRRAMLELIDSRKYSHPMFWAPFVYVGA